MEHFAEIPSAPFVSLSVVSNSAVQVNFTSPFSDGGSAINTYKVSAICFILHSAMHLRSAFATCYVSVCLNHSQAISKSKRSIQNMFGSYYCAKILRNCLLFKGRVGYRSWKAGSAVAHNFNLRWSERNPVNHNNSHTNSATAVAFIDTNCCS